MGPYNTDSGNHYINNHDHTNTPCGHSATYTEQGDALLIVRLVVSANIRLLDRESVKRVTKFFTLSCFLFMKKGIK